MSQVEFTATATFPDVVSIDNGLGPTVVAFDAPSLIFINGIGEVGPEGPPGVSVIGGTVNGSGNLILEMSNGAFLNVGSVVGPQGDVGDDGPPGLSVSSATVNGSNELILTMSNGSTINAGVVVGPQGTSVTSATVNVSGHLILTLSTGSTVDAGYVVGPTGPPGADGSGSGDMSKSTYDTNDNGKVDSAEAADTVPWSGVTSKPTTVSGFGITDAYTKAEIDSSLSGKANSSHTHTTADITGLDTALAGKAALSGANFSGPVNVTTQTAGNNSTLAASTAFVTGAIATLINSAPGLLDTLDEIAAALNDDPNFAATMTTALAGKQPIDANITSINSRAYSAGQMIYWTADEVTAVISTTSFGRGLLNLADGDALRSAAAAFAAAGGAIGGQTYINYFTSTAGSSPFYMRPSDWGTGKPQLGFFKHATAARWDFILFDGVNNAGTINIQAGNFTVNDVPVVTTTGAETLLNKTIERPYITNGYTEELATYNSGTTANIDLSAGSIHYVTLTANWTPSAIPVATAGRGFVLFVKQDATGGRTITWPSNVKWPSDTAPVLTATASKADKIAFQCIDGTNWHAHVVGQNFTVT